MREIATENLAISNINKTLMPARRINTYLALEDLDFAWDEKEVIEFREMWEAGIPIEYIANNFGRDVDEIVLLIMDQCRNGKITPRVGGVFGKGV